MKIAHRNYRYHRSYIKKNDSLLSPPNTQQTVAPQVEESGAKGIFGTMGKYAYICVSLTLSRKEKKELNIPLL